MRDIRSEDNFRRRARRRIVSAMRDCPVTGGAGPQDIVRRLDLPFQTDPVDAPQPALGL